MKGRGKNKTHVARRATKSADTPKVASQGENLRDRILAIGGIKGGTPIREEFLTTKEGVSLREEFRASHIDANIGGKSNCWRGLQKEFQELCEREKHLVPKDSDDYLHAFCDYTTHLKIFPETGFPGVGYFCLLTAPPGLWQYSCGVDDNFRERFRALATRAGIALGCPEEVDAEDFWLHWLYVDMRKNNSELLTGRSADTDTIARVSKASATFSSRIEKQVLNQQNKRQVEIQEEAATSPAENKRESFVRSILDKNGWSVLDWSKKSGVDFNTANGYLKGNRNSYPSTRKKLADALGVVSLPD